jgi:uracil-DNA glycosylase
MASDTLRHQMLFDLIPPPWQAILQNQKFRIDEIGRELTKRADRGERILPNRGLVFRALEIPPESVSVLIIGQDPYPNPNDACGLAFSVTPRSSGLPGSLLNLQKEIITDIGATSTADGDLTRWAEQGVMLLNRILTVTAGESGSHSDLGWQEITLAIAQDLAKRNVISVLWGNTARELESEFSEELLITGVHPSPLSAHRGFLGSKPFSQINEKLLKQNRPAIIW